MNLGAIFKQTDLFLFPSRPITQMKLKLLAVETLSTGPHFWYFIHAPCVLQNFPPSHF